jgi:hypothetical protein
MDDTIRDVKWPEWATALVFDRDGSSDFFEHCPARCDEFGIWQTDGRYEEAVQNEDFHVPEWAEYPIGTCLTRD